MDHLPMAFLPHYLERVSLIQPPSEYMPKEQHYQPMLLNKINPDKVLERRRRRPQAWRPSPSDLDSSKRGILRSKLVQHKTA